MGTFLRRTKAKGTCTRVMETMASIRQNKKSLISGPCSRRLFVQLADKIAGSIAICHAVVLK